MALSLIRLVYMSRSTMPAMSAAEAEAFVQGFQGSNRRTGLTGFLLIGAGWFAQALEGEPTAVRALFDRIEADPRHADVVVLEDRSIDDREFGTWEMAWGMAEEGETIDSHTGVTNRLQKALLGLA